MPDIPQPFTIRAVHGIWPIGMDMEPCLAWAPISQPMHHPMCDHPISQAVLQVDRGPSVRAPGSEFACEVYATHGVELHRIVSRVLECAECAEMLVAHTFLVRRSVGGVQPTLAQLTRTALVFACSALGDSARQQLQTRIRAWHIGSITDPGAYKIITTPRRVDKPR